MSQKFHNGGRTYRPGKGETDAELSARLAAAHARDAFDDLRIAARQVVASWERGDLATAVRNLDAALQRLDNLPR